MTRIKIDAATYRMLDADAPPGRLYYSLFHKPHWVTVRYDRPRGEKWVAVDEMHERSLSGPTVVWKQEATPGTAGFTAAMAEAQAIVDEYYGRV